MKKTVVGIAAGAVLWSAVGVVQALAVIDVDGSILPPEELCDAESNIDCLIMPDEDSSERDGWVFSIASPSSTQRYWIDPVVATGYHYAIVSPGSAYFTSVVLPSVALPGGGADTVFDLFLAGAATPSAVLAAGVEYFFDNTTTKVTEFTIKGIDESAGLDPNNAQAFATGLKFDSPDNIVVSQTPISTVTGTVPEPATLLLLGSGLLGMGWRRARG